MDLEIEQTQNRSPQPPAPETPVAKQDCASPVIYALLCFWAVFVTVLRLGAEVFTSLISPDTLWRSLVYLPVLQGLAILLPALLLTLFWKNRRYRSIFRAWAWSAFFILWMIPVHYVASVTILAQAIWNLVFCLAFLVFFLFVNRKALKAARWTFRFDRTAFLALLINGLLALPWLAWGALGSALDTIILLGMGLAVGYLAAVIGEYFITPNFVQPGSRTLGSNFFGGFTLATTLMILISAIGLQFGVMHFFLILVLIPLGWVWMCVRRRQTQNPSEVAAPLNLAFPALLVGLAVAIPLTLVDANELALIISMSTGEILEWSLRAALVSSLIGFAWAFGLLAVGARPAPRLQRFSTYLIYPTLAIWLIGAAIYVFLGQPGFHGDRLLVIFKDQADLSTAAQIVDYPQRRQAVYDTLVNQADQSQASIRPVLDRLRVPYQAYYLVNAIEIPNNPLLSAWLGRRSEVDRIVESPRMRPLAQTPPSSTGNDLLPAGVGWNLTMIGADRVWKEFKVTGRGIIIGQSDSGVAGDHPDLQDQYRGKDGSQDYNWLDPWNSSPSPVDVNGHGTHTLGTILGKQSGVAPDATWIGCVNLSRNMANPALYLDCLQFMLAPYPQSGDPFADGRPELGAMVLNNSWGCPPLEGCDANTLLTAVEALRQAGVFVVASAGNDGPDCSTVKDPLALYADAFSVGAVDESGELAFFSSLGPVTIDGSERVKPDLVAPGVDILSTFPDGTYAYESGTSMAGPHVVGVVALIWSANPALIGNIEQTEQILQESARPYSGTLPDCPGAQGTPSTAVGYGLIDAYAAVKEALASP